MFTRLTTLRRIMLLMLAVIALLQTVEFTYGYYAVVRHWQAQARAELALLVGRIENYLTQRRQQLLPLVAQQRAALIALSQRPDDWEGALNLDSALSLALPGYRGFALLDRSGRLLSKTGEIDLGAAPPVRQELTLRVGEAAGETVLDWRLPLDADPSGNSLWIRLDATYLLTLLREQPEGRVAQLIMAGQAWPSVLRFEPVTGWWVEQTLTQWPGRVRWALDATLVTAEWARLAGLAVLKLACYLGLLLVLWRALARADASQCEAEATVRNLNQQLRALIEQLPEATLLCDPQDFKILDANAAALSVLHLGAAQSRQQALQSFVPTEIWPAWQQFLADAAQARGAARHAELPWQIEEGLGLRFQVSASLVTCEGRGQLLLVLRDVTLAVRMQQQLRVQEERLRLALTAAGLGWIDWNVTTDVCTFSDNFHAFLPGIDPTLSWQTLWPRAVAAEDAPRYAAQLDAHLRGQSVVFEQEFRVQAPESEGEYWLRQIGQVLSRTATGAPERMLSVLQDISARKQTEQVQRLSAVVFESQQATIVLDRRWRTQLSNKAAQELSGYTEAMLAGYPALSLTVQLPETPRVILRLLRQTGRWQGEVMARLALGPCSLWLVISAVGGGARNVRYVVQIIDMTGRRQLQEYSQRLSGSRLFARHLIAAQETERKFLARELHDAMGQYLVGIRLYAGLIGDTEDAAERAGFVAEIERAADAIHQVVRGINRRLLPADLEATGLLGGLRNLVTQLAKYKELRAEFTLLPQDAALNETFDEMLALGCYRVVQESLNNVVKHAHAQQVKVVVRVEKSGPRPHLAIAVQDDGIGMDLVEGMPLGKGVGLLGMRERVEALGGEFTLTSVPGLGTHLTLVFALPGVETALEASAVTPNAV